MELIRLQGKVGIWPENVHDPPWGAGGSPKVVADKLRGPFPVFGPVGHADRLASNSEEVG